MTPSAGYTLDPATEAALQQMAQQEAAMSWSGLMGTVTNGVPATGSPILSTLNQGGYTYGPGINNIIPTLAALNQSGYSLGPGGTTSPTLAALLQAGSTIGPGGTTQDTLQKIAQQAGLTGMYNNQLTMPVQEATGMITGPNGQQTATTTEQQMAGNLLNQMLSNNNSLTPFTYLAQQQGVGSQLNPLSRFLQGGIYGATGQTQQQLANQPNLTVSQVAQLANAAGGNFNNFLGNMTSAMNQNAASGTGGINNNTLSALYNSKPSNDQLYNPNQPATGMANNDLVAHAMGLLYNSKPATGASGSPSGTPTGWGSSLQQFNQLGPTAQSALTNLIQSGGGQSAADFTAGMKAAAPEMQKAAFANSAFSQL